MKVIPAALAFDMKLKRTTGVRSQALPFYRQIDLMLVAAHEAR